MYIYVHVYICTCTYMYMYMVCMYLQSQLVNIIKNTCDKSESNNENHDDNTVRELGHEYSEEQ